MQAFNINKAEAQKILQIKSEAEYKILRESFNLYEKSLEILTTSITTEQAGLCGIFSSKEIHGRWFGDKR